MKLERLKKLHSIYHQERMWHTAGRSFLGLPRTEFPPFEEWLDGDGRLAEQYLDEVWVENYPTHIFYNQVSHSMNYHDWLEKRKTCRHTITNVESVITNFGTSSVPPTKS